MNNYVAFHTPNLVWDSTIAIYLFLLGVASGATLLALIYKHTHKLADPSKNWLIRSAAVIAPSSVMIGLTLLIFHLTKPWTFWYLMFNYQFHSIMSMGVMMFQLYMSVIFLWIAITFKELIATLIHRFIPAFKFVNSLINFAAKFISLIEILLFILAILLGVYTGFLLSDLISYPMLNTLWLPALFLASGTSSGIAALLIALLVVGKLSPHSKEIHFLHKLEKPTVTAEILLLIAFFTNLYLGGGQKTVSVINALSGFWGTIFWVGVVGIGILLPLVTNLLANEKLKHQKAFILFLATAGLTGVICLRYFILYAGQLTIA
ncbi:cytochrome c nitrite reductase subunit NrfD [Vespertiliibacter pulmonis]|uniref:Respiratory nitrite reductase-specific menaquinol--cytochrome-c reductase complex subunit NrfD n=1 Tax=Vespertiliibacter pulmonis TaxID=1443036 RepID=A0A3N4VKI2_9PAST|nr:cytochrome c nitrite reductase subunit NrfD [Vespertiliibacter pulmonis]QLB20925.1 cytochrome c nitrite reductase subunit NrfD [Vespertiliibacter pulmonis]RPE83582.1 respiratory nitrite reductase-specific menaquinol--cytochrome-c reductase complex subunit NrfD [Vespertiliibacter pulmonis]